MHATLVSGDTVSLPPGCFDSGPYQCVQKHRNPLFEYYLTICRQGCCILRMTLGARRSHVFPTPSESSDTRQARSSTHALRLILYWRHNSITVRFQGPKAAESENFCRGLHECRMIEQSPTRLNQVCFNYRNLPTALQEGCLRKCDCPWMHRINMVEFTNHRWELRVYAQRTL